jgi:16S rRNA processing protein RimM
MITVSKDERAELSEDEYWIDDIVGIRVLDSASEAELGILEEVIRTGSNDVYLIRTADGQLKPIPALAEAVKNVDTEAGIMLVTVPEGLWD